MKNLKFIYLAGAVFVVIFAFVGFKNKSDLEKLNDQLPYINFLKY